MDENPRELTFHSLVAMALLSLADAGRDVVELGLGRDRGFY